MEDRVNAEKTLDTKLGDLDAYFHLAEEETDPAQRESILEELSKELEAIDAYVSELETKTLLAGESDRLSAILTVKPGAGGTESQDWAEMLLRMYLRWAEQKGFRATVLDSTPGEEAGIKSATVPTACWQAKAACIALSESPRSIKPLAVTLLLHRSS